MSLLSSSSLAALSTTSLIVSESKKDIEVFSTCSGSDAFALATVWCGGCCPLAVAAAPPLPALLNMKARDMISKKIGIPFCVDKSSHSCS